MSGIEAFKTNMEIMAELGRRLRQYRLQQNLPIADVARNAGLSATTVINLENGGNPRLESMVRVLRVLGRLEALDAFLPVPEISPIQLARLRGHPRQRARKPRRGD